MSRPLTYCVTLLLLSLVGAALGQTPMQCGTAQVLYRPAPQNLADKIQLTRLATQPDAPSSARRVNSPQATRWFLEVDPDYTSTKEPWNTTVYIHAGGPRDRVTRLDVRDHGNTFTAQWINEKLLFVQVWWGNIASSDLILDIDQAKITCHELANYAETMEPCEGRTK